jgi:peptidase E
VVSAEQPTVVATSMGLFCPRVPGIWQAGLRPTALASYLKTLAGSPSRPRLCYLGTAGGDDAGYTAAMYAAFAGTEFAASHLALFSMPNVADLEAHLCSQDIVFVGGGSVANLLAVWRVHGLDAIFAKAYQAGVVLSGVSAGSICWHFGGTTDSFGPELRAVTNGLGLISYGNGVHYDSEPGRRPLLRSLVRDGVLPTSYATDDDVGVTYRSGAFVEAVALREGPGAYRLERTSTGDVIETRIEPTLIT